MNITDCIERWISEIHRKHDLRGKLLLVIFFMNLLYLTYLLIIGYVNSIRVDDYCNLARQNQYGILGSIEYMYNNWQGRFSPQLLNNLIVRFYTWSGTTVSYLICLIVLFVYSINSILKSLLTYLKPQAKWNYFLGLNISLLIFVQFVQTNFEFNTFFWITASTMYFGGIAFALLGVNEIISKSTTFKSYLIIIVSFAYAGSSAEHFGAICTIILLFFLMLHVAFNRMTLKDIFKSQLTIKLLLALTLCSIAFVVMVTAPGNEVRRLLMPESSLISSFFIAVRSYSDLLALILKDQLRFYLLFCPLFIYFGTLFRTKTNEFRVVVTIVSSLPFFLLFIYVCLLPTAYAVSGLGPLRALTHVTFYITVYLAFLSFLIGYSTNFPKKLSFLLASFSCVLFLFVTTYYIKIKLPDTIKYELSERKRVITLLSLKSQHLNKTVEIQKLSSGKNNVLLYHEISSDSSYWVNQCICRGLELDFDIKLKEDISND